MASRGRRVPSLLQGASRVLQLGAAGRGVESHSGVLPTWKLQCQLSAPPSTPPQSDNSSIRSFSSAVWNHHSGAASGAAPPGGVATAAAILPPAPKRPSAVGVPAAHRQGAPFQEETGFSPWAQMRRLIQTAVSRHAGIRTPGKKLKVVLRRHMEGLGNVGDVVRVSPGYARNFLIPLQKAYPALPKYVEFVREAKEQGLLEPTAEDLAAASAKAKADSAPAEVSQGDIAREAAAVAERLDRMKLSIRRIVPRKSNELRQPVTYDDIIAEVARQFGITLCPQNIGLKSPIQTVGEVDVPLVFPQDVELPSGKEHISLKVNVRRL